MTAYSIGSQPQAIYPDGHNVSFAITNKGPRTVLIDNVSSIGPGSYELPPFTTISWDARNPLWIAAKTPPNVGGSYGDINSTIVVTKNTDAAITPRGQASVQLADVLVPSMPNHNTTPIKTVPIETEAFSTLIINYQSLAQAAYTTTAPPTSNWNWTWIYWYNSNGEITAQDTFYHPLQDSGSSYLYQRLVTRVKDSYAVIYTLDTNNNVGWTLSYKVYGQIRELPESFEYWQPNDASLYPLHIWPGAVGVDSFADTAQALEWWNAATPQELWLSPIKPRLTVNLRVLNTTVVGSLILETPYLSMIVASAAIPVTAAGNVVLTTDYIPIGQPLRLRSTAATGIGRLVCVWQD